MCVFLVVDWTWLKHQSGSIRFQKISFFRQRLDFPKDEILLFLAEVEVKSSWFCKKLTWTWPENWKIWFGFLLGTSWHSLGATPCLSRGCLGRHERRWQNWVWGRGFAALSPNVIFTEVQTSSNAWEQEFGSCRVQIPNSAEEFIPLALQIIQGMCGTEKQYTEQGAGVGNQGTINLRSHWTAISISLSG